MCIIGTFLTAPAHFIHFSRVRRRSALHSYGALSSFTTALSSISCAIASCTYTQNIRIYKTENSCACLVSWWRSALLLLWSSFFTEWNGTVVFVFPRLQLLDTCPCWHRQTNTTWSRAYFSNRYSVISMIKLHLWAIVGAWIARFQV